MSSTPPPGSFLREELLAFLAATRDRQPQPLTVDAIRLAQERHPGGIALEIGCGAGVESEAMLAAGLAVEAVDLHQEAIDWTLARIGAAGLDHRCTPRLGAIERLPIAARRYALIHARFALPFVGAADFPSLWDRLRDALLPGGIFAGQLFGPEDQFIRERPEGSMNFHDGSAVDRLLDGFEPLQREEVSKAGQTALGREKWWHVHHLLLRRANR
jgi:cyclopropane fatty-acyl-phospholipid synthase-like methyltransferase